MSRGIGVAARGGVKPVSNGTFRSVGGRGSRAALCWRGKGVAAIQAATFLLRESKSDMSATSSLRPVLPAEIRARKGAAPLVVLTAYTTAMARIVDAHCDVALVGDSLGMVLYGMPSTLGVTMEMMIAHGRAVVNACKKAMPVIDMPFGSYEEGPQQAFRNAARLMAETGAPAVKLEGGRHMAETIAYLTKRGVAVMAHIGLTPQSVNMPSMSSTTSTCPSQRTPAPMPMVGMVSFWVMRAESPSGTFSSTTAKAPAASTASASAMTCSASASRPTTL